jgi:hypothetical protein
MSTPTPTPGQSIMQRDHKVYTGTIAYISNKPERKGQERGREFYTLVVHGDGSRTITVHTEIDDRPSVHRDAIYSLDKNWLPLDCMMRLTVGDKFMGTGWMKFYDNYAECETFTATEGRVSQKYALKAPLKTFQNHAIACDSWHFKHYDIAKGGLQTIGQILLSSPDHRGATGPLFYAINMSLDYVGKEKVTVKAGTFDAYHFQFPGTKELITEHPPYEIWTTADGEFTFLKGGVAGYMQTYYELIDFKDVTPPKV